jgi:hypothetical protein
MANKGTCKASDCDKGVRAKGYCDRHYRRWKAGKMPKPRYKTCHSEGCRKPITRRGLCQEHFAATSKKKAEPAAAEAPAS